jgi:hypothetical protein
MRVSFCFMGLRILCVCLPETPCFTTSLSVAALGVCNAAVTSLAKSRDPGTRFTCRFYTDRVFLTGEINARSDQMWRLQMEFGRLLGRPNACLFGCLVS